MKRAVGILLSVAMVSLPLASARAQDVSERTHESAHFSVTWTTTQGDPDAPALGDADEDGVPDSIERLLVAFERAYSLEVEELGYRPPPVEGLYPIYVAQGDGSGFTQRAPGGDGVSAPSFIVVPPQRFDASVSDDRILVFAAHEFFHAIQIGYNAHSEHWIEEASSTWIETIAAPDAANALGYLSSFVPNPRTGLPQGFGEYEYGSFLFVEFLVERYGTEPRPMDIVRQLWETIAAAEGPVTTLEALRDLLGQRGVRVEDAWAEFLLWRRQLRRFQEGEAYRAVATVPRATKIAPVASESCRLTTDSDGQRLAALSGDYFRLVPASAAPARGVARLTVRGPQGAGGFALLKAKDGEPTLSMLTFDDDGVAVLDIPFGRREAVSLTLGLGNASSFPATLEYSLRYPGLERVDVTTPSSQNVTTYGVGVFVSGSVSCGEEPAAFADVEVVATEIVSGAQRAFRLRTDGLGRWALVDTPLVNSTYSVRVVDPLLSETASSVHQVGVALAVDTIVTPDRPVLGEPVSVSGSIRPAHPGTEVIVEFRRPSARRWREGGRAVTGEDGRYDVSVTLPATGVWQIRSRVPQTGDLDHLPGVGAIRLVSVRAAQ